MGVVYKASDPTIGRLVALKVLTLEPATDEGTHSPQEMFMREVRAAGRLTHPSIVTIHDAFEDPDTNSSCIVMELISGKTLESILIAGQMMTIEETLSLIRQVGEALDYAHRNQVVHRDLKPANILVTDDGRIKITDFGIAKVLAREGVARTIGVMGTPSYMSPEQVKGGDIDGRTDLFSLGIILFLMLTGQKPFLGDTASVMFRIVYEEPPLPSSVNPQLTAAHDYVCLRCLAKDRNQRYPSARELLNDLDDLQNGRAPRSREAAQPPPPAAPLPAEQTLVSTIPVLRVPEPSLGPASSAGTPPAPLPKAVAAPPGTTLPAPRARGTAGRPGDPTVADRSKSKPHTATAILGVVVVLLLAAGGFGYIRYRRIMRTQTPPPQIALLPPPAPPEVEPMAPAPPANPPKAPARTPKPALTPAPVPAAPPPAVAPPATSVLPAPKPVVAAPSPEDTAGVETAKFASVPHVIQVHCQYDLKEAKFTFSGGGQTFFQGNFKGKKKGGFLGIKGSYEGTFLRTLTVPAGVTEISIHVVSKDGATDLSNITPLGGPGGFVPP